MLTCRKEPHKILTAATKHHRLHSVMQCQIFMHSPWFHPIVYHVPTITLMKVDGRRPKSVLKL